MMRRSGRVAFLATIWLLSCGTLLRAESPGRAKKSEPGKPAAGKFIRVGRDAAGRPTTLETAVVRYVPATGEAGVEVDLVGAVHIGDRSYYEKLNKRFEQYDVVLYELVAPPGTRIPRAGKRSDNPIALVQQIMKVVLDLDSQTERVDYTKKNFVHADLSPEQMAEAIRKRGDDGLTLFLSIAADMLRQQNLQEMNKQDNGSAGEADADVMSLLLDPEGPVKLKRMMAEQMAAIESAEGGGLGRTLNTILITDRNAAAIKVLQKELTRGRKKIAIFYGAGHMPDFDRRLRDDFGMKRAGEDWLTAWDIRVKEKGLDDILEIIKLLGE